MLSSGTRATRRPHRKTRNGCMQCKQRKIKCDESKPICGHCTRYSSECSFLHESQPDSSPGSGIGTGNSTNIACSRPIGSDVGSYQAFLGPDFETRNYEYLHFYTTTTAMTFSNIPQTQKLWQNIVPRIAFSHPFLLHGIFSLAAIHLARLDPSRKKTLYAEASVHHNASVTLFRPLLANITKENCNACFASSTVLLIYAWASSDGTGDLFFTDTSNFSSDSETIKWIRLLRGASKVLMSSWEWISEGPLEPLLHLLNGYQEELSSENVSPEDERLAALTQLWEPPKGNFDATELDALAEALSLLRESYRYIPVFDTEVCSVAVTFAWPVRVPEAYITMVKKRIPEALVLLAHYCLLLNKLNGFWWIDGMSRHLLQTIHKVLGEDWESWIGWPLQELVLSEFKKEI